MVEPRILKRTFERTSGAYSVRLVARFCNPATADSFDALASDNDVNVVSTLS